MKVLVPLIIFILINSPLFAQPNANIVVLPLRMMQGNPPIIAQLSTSAVEDFADIKNIPSGFKFWCIRKWTVVHIQDLYEQILTGKSDSARFENWAKSVAMIDSPYTYISRTIVPGNKLFFFVGIDAKGRKNVIADANNNMDFRDDKLFVFDTSFFSKKLKPADKGVSLNLAIEYYDRFRKVVIKTSTPVILNPYEYYNEEFENDPKEKILDLIIECTRFRQAEFNRDGKNYIITVSNNHNELPFTDRFNSTIIIKNDEGKVNYYKLYDKVKLGDTVFQLSGIKEESQLVLKPTKM